MSELRTALALIGCLFVGVGIGMLAERWDILSPDNGWKLALSIAALLAIWGVK